MLCSSCGVTLKSKVQRAQYDIAMKRLDSLNTIVAMKDIYKNIVKIEDNSRITITKYQDPDSSGQQAIDYVVEVAKDVKTVDSLQVDKEDVIVHQETHTEELVDNSVVDTEEKYESPPAVRWVKHFKGIIALLLIGYIIYKFKRN